MRFTDIPDDELALNQGSRVSFRGPEASSISDLPTMVRHDVGADRLVAVTARVEFSADDLALLAGGAPLYITMYGGCIPISVDIPAERVAIPDDARQLAEGYREGMRGE